MNPFALRHWNLLPCLALLAACTGTPPTQPGTQGIATNSTAANAAQKPAPQASRYTLDAAASSLHILVYRGGTLARLGHNHVISSRSLQGKLWRGASLEDSGFSITVPVNDLIVDDADARAAEGPDFPLNVGEEARQGTKVNMMRDTLLDGARYPDISIQSTSLQGAPDAPEVIAELRIKDRTRPIALPVKLLSTQEGLRVQGEFEIKQTDFGITPLSVAMGALLVQDTIKIKFELVAKPD